MGEAWKWGWTTTVARETATGEKKEFRLDEADSLFAVLFGRAARV
jgi:hypothetical protein